MATASNDSPVQRKTPQQINWQIRTCSTGNTLLANKNLFCKWPIVKRTKYCQIGYRTFNGKELMIYDTPGLFDTQDGHDVIKAEIARAIQMASPGPHAFLILFKIGNRFTDEEKKTIETIQDMFGKDADKFCILLFTHEDYLIHEGKKIEDYLETANPGQTETDIKLQQLLEMIDTMLAENQVRYYTNKQELKDSEKPLNKEREELEKLANSLRRQALIVEEAGKNLLAISAAVTRIE